MRSLFILLLALAPALAWGSLAVTISDSSLDLDQTFTVELELDRASSDTPDISVLSEQFAVLSLERMLLRQSSRDEARFTTRWTLKLKPRVAGSLTLPAISVSGERSEPVQLRVSAQEISSDIEIKPLILPDKIYPKAPALLEVIIHHEQPLPDSAFVALTDNDPVQIRTLTELTTQPGSTARWASRQQFALYFDRFGAVKTPTITLIAENARLLNEYPGELISVEEPGYQSESAVWLPAEQLSLADSWQGVTQIQPKADQPVIERRITVEALGPIATDLPPLPLPEGFVRIDSETSEQVDAFGVRAQRSEVWEYALADQTQIDTLASELIWWDLNAEQTRTLTLPARSIAVDRADPSLTDTHPGPEDSQSTALYLASLIALFSSVAALALLWVWQRQRQRINEERDRWADELTSTQIQLEEHQAYFALESACLRNQADRAAHWLARWCDFIWPGVDTQSLDSLCLSSDDAQFNLLVFQLNDYLINPEESDWDGEALLEKVRALRRQHLMLQSDKSDLGETDE